MAGNDAHVRAWFKVAVGGNTQEVGVRFTCGAERVLLKALCRNGIAHVLESKGRCIGQALATLQDE
jgi:hypothetical protein